MVDGFRSTVWHYVAVFALAVTLFANLKAFFDLGYVVRYTLDRYAEVLGLIWNQIFSYFSIEISQQEACLITGALLFLSLALSPAFSPKIWLFRKIEDIVDHIVSRPMSRMIVKRPTGFSQFIGLGGWEFLLLIVLLSLPVILVWLALFWPFWQGLDLLNYALLASAITNGCVMMIGGEAYRRFGGWEPNEQKFETREQAQKYFNELPKDERLRIYSDGIGKSFSRPIARLTYAFLLFSMIWLVGRVSLMLETVEPLSRATS